MSTLFVNNLNTASGNDITVAASKNLKMGTGIFTPSSGQIVQYVTRDYTMNFGTFNSASSTAMTDVYVDITPKSASNKIVWYTQFVFKNDSDGGYSKFSVYNHNTTTQWGSGYNGTNGYTTGSNTANQWMETPVTAVNTAGTTSTMRLMAYIITPNGGTSNFGWSNGSIRQVHAYEIQA
tara:strand:- start:1060 stop:1596 length:537 start_codon:yes stop_codon:yes gene_type:complete